MVNYHKEPIRPNFEGGGVFYLNGDMFFYKLEANNLGEENVNVNENEIYDEERRQSKGFYPD
jgi:hypothetical protein